MSRQIRRLRLRLLAAVVLCAGALSAAGCATLAHGSHQDVEIASEPPGASVRVGETLVGVTPARLSLERRQAHLVLRVEKEGFRPVEVPLVRKTSWWIALNVAAGGAQFANQGLSSTSQAATAAVVVGALAFGTDYLSGAAYQLDPPRVHVVLEPLDPPRR
jgi:hypothetical protein